MKKDTTKLPKFLTPQEITERIDKFNETYDYHVFDDVPPMQQYAVLYPYKMRAFKIAPDKFKEDENNPGCDKTNE